METERSMPRHTIYDLSLSLQVVHGAPRFRGDHVCAPAVAVPFLENHKFIRVTRTKDSKLVCISHFFFFYYCRCCRMILPSSCIW